jgi:RNA recognition motif-containing protein
MCLQIKFYTLVPISLVIIFYFLIFLFISNMNIFVAKLSSGVSGDDLKELFEEYGEVVSANVIKDKFTGESKRFGFVEMSNDEEAQKAIDGLDGCEYDKSVIVVKKAEPREERPRGGGFNSGGNRGGFRRDDNRGGGDRGNYRGRN